MLRFGGLNLNRMDHSSSSLILLMYGGRFDLGAFKSGDDYWKMLAYIWAREIMIKRAAFAG